MEIAVTGDKPSEDRDGLVVAEQLAAEIRGRRRAADLSQPELAARVGYSRQYVSLAERPKKGLPSAELVTALDAALEAHGELVALRDRAVRERHSRRHRHNTQQTFPPRDLSRGGGGQVRRAGGLDDQSPIFLGGLASVSGSVDSRAVTAEAARGSLAFACWASSDRIAPAVVEHVLFELGRIAREYVSAPLPPLFGDLLRVRDTMFEVLRAHPHSQRSRELFFLTGTTCVLLAHASQNLGDPAAAMAQASTALSCAEHADHRGLRAWILGTQALIAEWSGQPARAVAFVRSGRQLATTPASRIRLLAIEARALARVGNAEAASAALHQAQRAHEVSGEDDELTGLGGVLSFPPAKQLAYAGATFNLLGQHQPAEAAAARAINIYETGPPQHRSYGDEALARTDLATARLAGHDIEGARSALLPVLALPTHRRIGQLIPALGTLRATLALPPYRKLAPAVELAEGIDGFSIPPLPAPATGP